MDLTILGFFLFLLWGCLVGFLAGLFGIGGGALIVPILILTYEHSGLPPSVLSHVAVGTSLLVVFFASLTSAYQHQKQRNIHVRAALILGLSSAVTAFGIARIATHLRGQVLQTAFAIVIISVALRMLLERGLRDEERAEFVSKGKGPFLAGIGFAAGIISSLAGVGGAGITIPMLYYLLHMPLKLVIGTSSAAIVLTGLFSVTGYILSGWGHADLPSWCLGFVDLPRGIALVIGSLLMARIGAYVSFRTRPQRLRRFYALFLIIISTYILFFK
jgi:uncharacterized protein